MIDKFSVIGLALGIFAVFGGGIMEGIHVMSLIQFTAFLIVVGGSVGAMLLTTPEDTLKLGIKMIRDLFFFDANQAANLANDIVKYAEMARRESILGMEKVVDEVSHPFLKKALRSAVDGLSPETIQEVLEREIQIVEERETNVGKMWEACGGYAPTIGIIGAVLGLIHVMNGLAQGGSTEQLGEGIAVAFVATIYGVGSANLLFIPMGGKLKARASYNKRLKQMMLIGIIGMVQGLNPRIIQERLKIFYE